MLSRTPVRLSAFALLHLVCTTAAVAAPSRLEQGGTYCATNTGLEFAVLMGQGNKFCETPAIPDCDSAGMALNFNRSTKAFGCVTGLGSGDVDSFEGRTGAVTAADDDYQASEIEDGLRGMVSLGDCASVTDSASTITSCLMGKIKEAYGKAAANGGTGTEDYRDVEIPPGKWVVNEQIIIPGGVTLDGYARGGSIIECDDSMEYGALTGSTMFPSPEAVLGGSAAKKAACVVIGDYNWAPDGSGVLHELAGTLGANPVSTTNGSATVTITFPGAHYLTTGTNNDTITIDGIQCPSDVCNGIPEAQLNGEKYVASVPSSTNITFAATTTATSTGTPTVASGARWTGTVGEIAFGAGLRNLVVRSETGDTDPQSVGLFTRRAQEQSGTDGVVVSWFNKYGIHIQAGNVNATAQNYTFTNGQSILSSVAESSGGCASGANVCAAMFVEGAHADHKGIDNWTFSTQSAVTLGNSVGLLLEDVYAGAYTRINAEHVESGVQCGRPGKLGCKGVLLSGIEGGNGDLQLINFTEDSHSNTVIGAAAKGATVTIEDTPNSVTITDDHVGFYATGPTVGDVITNVATVPSRFPDDLTVVGTVAAGTVTGGNVTSGANPGHTHDGTSIGGLAAGDTTSGVFDPARLCTGTAASGKYCDGAGAWTTLPAGGGSSIVLDLADDGSNESSGVTEVAVVGDDYGVFSEPSADKLKIDWSKTITVTGGEGIAITPSLDAVREVKTDSSEAGFLESGTATCGASTAGKIAAGDTTTALNYCDGFNQLRYAAYGSSAGVASSASALAANGGNCSAGQYATGVDASGVAEGCTADDDSPDSDGEVPNNITVDLATAASALAANGGNCSAGQKPSGVTAAGVAEGCEEVPLSDGITGGQTICGSDTTAQDLQLHPNCADTTTGKVLLGAGAAYDAAESCLAVGKSSCTTIANQSGTIEVLTETSGTNLMKTVLRSELTSSGTVAAGFGAQHRYFGENAAGTSRAFGDYGFGWDDATDGSEDAFWQLSLKQAGATNPVIGWRMNSLFQVTWDEAAAASTPADGEVACWIDTTDETLKCKDKDGVVTRMVTIGTDVQAYDSDLAAYASTANAPTATQLAANGDNCPSGQYARGVNADGDAEDCTAAGAGSGDVTAASNITDNAIVRGDGGAKGVQTSGITIDDSNVIHNATLDGAELTGTTTVDDFTPVNSTVNFGSALSPFQSSYSKAWNVVSDTGTVSLYNAAGTQKATWTVDEANNRTTIEAQNGAALRILSPQLTTPALGTPASCTLTNCTGLPTAGIVDDAVTNAKAANMAAKTIKGRRTNSTGDPEDLPTTGWASGGKVVMDTSPVIGTTLDVNAGGTTPTFTTGRIFSATNAANSTDNALGGMKAGATGYAGFVFGTASNADAGMWFKDGEGLYLAGAGAIPGSSVTHARLPDSSTGTLQAAINNVPTYRSVIVSGGTNTTSTGNGAGNGDTDCASYTVPLNTLGADGQAIPFTAAYSTAANGTTNKLHKFWFAGTAIWSSGTNAANNSETIIRGVIVRTSNTQVNYWYTVQSTVSSWTTVASGSVSSLNLSTTSYTLKATTSGTNASDSFCKMLMWSVDAGA
ncbi:MAG TPA: hypothetical protein VEL28_06730 [Candidatus Binatia bacterium]|nr:hypothetical protein [Candidatus Binatia bacterium]